MFVVDTNVLVYAADEDSSFHQPCCGLLEKWRAQSGAWYVTWAVLYEFLRITTHPRVFRAPWPITHAWKFIEILLASPGLEVLGPTERHAQVAAELFRQFPHLSGNIMHDAHTAC